MLFPVISLATIIAFAHTTATANGAKLLQSIIVNRHGVRASANRIPSKPCAYFEGKFGEVTRMGEEENFKVGEHIADHYSELFTGGYKVKKHHFYSSGESKCLSSAQNTFHGIFSDSLIDQNPVTATPVRTWTISTDHIMMFSSTCKDPINTLGQKGTTTDEFKNKAKENKDVIAAIQQASGLSVTLSLGNIPLAAEQIILATHHIDFDGVDKTDCLYDNNTLNEKAIELATFRVQMFNRREDRELAKLQASPFVNYVLTLMKDRMNNSANPDFVFFSGSNPNVLAPLQLFNQPCPGRVPFGSYFYFDVYVMDGVPKTKPPFDESEIGIQVGYRVYDTKTNTFSVRNNSITTENCGGKAYCTIDDLKKMIYTNEEWNAICFPTDDPEPLTNNPAPEQTWTDDAVVIVIVLGVLLLAVAAIAVVFAIFAVYKAKVAASLSRPEPIAMEELKSVTTVVSPE